MGTLTSHLSAFSTTVYIQPPKSTAATSFICHLLSCLQILSYYLTTGIITGLVATWGWLIFIEGVGNDLYVKSFLPLFTWTLYSMIKHNEFPSLYGQCLGAN